MRAIIVPPSVGRPIGLRLAPFAGQFAHFLLHEQIHQLQAGLPDQLSHAFPQPAHHFGHGQHHLHRQISICGHCIELLAFSLEQTDRVDPYY
jgi:hypothetical protein